MELKPCPFCGGSAELCVHEATGVSWVRCIECETSGGATSEEHAIKAWNTRYERTCKAEMPTFGGLPIVDATPHCGECGMEWGTLPLMPSYCPNCGAKVVSG